MTAASLDASRLFRVDGLVAVITGGGTGIGLTMAKALAVNGAEKVFILGRRQQVLETAAAGHANLVPVQCDVTSKDSLQSAVDRVTSEVGYINLLVANSGAMGTSMVNWEKRSSVHEIRASSFTQETMDTFTSDYHVNVTGAFFTLLAFLGLLDEGNKKAVEGGSFGAPAGQAPRVPLVQSQVVFTSSIGAFLRTNPSAPSYAASKAALVHLTKQASTILADYSIRANALAPGLFPTEMSAMLVGDRRPEEETSAHPMFIPARRFGGDEEMAGVILFLASRAGSFCNGLILLHDGGRAGMVPATY